MPQQDALPPNVMNAVGSQPAPGPTGGGLPSPMGGGAPAPMGGGAPGAPGTEGIPPEALAAIDAVGQLVPDIVLAVFQALASSGPGGPPGAGPGGPAPGGGLGGPGGPTPQGPPVA